MVETVQSIVQDPDEFRVVIENLEAPPRKTCNLPGCLKPIDAEHLTGGLCSEHWKKHNEDSFEQGRKKAELDRLKRENDLVYHRQKAEQRKRAEVEAAQLTSALEKTEEQLVAEDAAFQKETERYSHVQPFKTFVTPGVGNILPVHEGSLVLIGAVTKHGKTTLAANIVEPIISEGSRVLHLSLEEAEDSFRKRVACLTLGLSFVRSLPHANVPLTEDEKSRLVAMVAKQRRLLSVIAVDKSVGITTVGGIKTVLDQAVNKNVKLVVLDYISKVSDPSVVGETTNVGAQQIVIELLDNFKDRQGGAPIVVFGQLIPGQKNTAQTFGRRFDSHKRLDQKATHNVEVVADKKNKMTTWVRHGWRWDDGRPDKTVTRLVEGRHVDILPDEREAYLKNRQYAAKDELEKLYDQLSKEVSGDKK